MTEITASPQGRVPPRLERANPLAFTLSFSAAAFVLWSLTSAGPSLDQLARGLPTSAIFSAGCFHPISSA